MRIGNEVACDIFNSCVKNPYVATLASGQSAPGFIEFMGSNAVQTGKVKISFDYSQDEETSYIDQMYPCDMAINSTVLDGYYVEPCTCNYCETACKANVANAYPLFFDGFDVAVVVIVYVALIILSVIIYFLKKRCASEKGEVSDTEENSASNVFEPSLDQSKQKLLNHSGDYSNSNDSKVRINKSSIREDTLDQVRIGDTKP